MNMRRLVSVMVVLLVGPQFLAAEVDVVNLRNGQVLTGQVVGQTLSITTSYAAVKLKVTDIARIQIGNPSTQSDEIQLKAGDRLSGVIVEEAITLRQGDGSETVLKKSAIERVILRTRDAVQDASLLPSHAPVAASAGVEATKDTPYVNSLGMKFAPVAGAGCLFSVWETRVQDFEAFVKASGHDATAGMYSLGSDGWKQRGDTWKSPGFRQGPTHPVCGVSWDDAKAFCAWLTEKERAAGRLPAGWAYRLPTDAEWSTAVGLERESGSTPKEKQMEVKDVYPWGTQWPPPKGAGNYCGVETKGNAGLMISGYDDGYERTSPAGSFAANRYGLYDMGGNAWEWCEDFYDGSSAARVLRVLRGASWVDGVRDGLLSSLRFGSDPVRRNDFGGFRCVLGRSAR